MSIRTPTPFLSALVVLSIATGPVYGQQSNTDNAQSDGQASQGPPRRTPPTPTQQLQRLSQTLGLTDQQKTVILPILEQLHASMQALGTGTTDPAGRQEQVRSLMESSNAQIRAQLTEAQQQIFDHMRPGRGPGGGAPGANGPSNGNPPSEPQ